MLNVHEKYALLYIAFDTPVTTPILLGIPYTVRTVHLVIKAREKYD